MATSESDDFESADEELNTQGRISGKSRALQMKNIVDSESDDDTEFIPTQSRASTQSITCNAREEIIIKKTVFNISVYNDSKFIDMKSERNTLPTDASKSKSLKLETGMPTDEKKVEIKSDFKPNVSKTEADLSKGKKNTDINCSDIKTEGSADTSFKIQRHHQPKQVRSFGAQRLGNAGTPGSIISRPTSEFTVAEDDRRKTKAEDKFSSQITNSTILENSSKNSSLKQNKEPEVEEIPEELKSNLKFKAIFKPDGWVHFDKSIELSDMLTDEKITPILDKISSISESQNESNNSWVGWGSWGVGSLLNTASASVSTLTNRVSQGLTLLEESMGALDPVDLVKADMHQQRNPIVSEEPPEFQENQSQSSFGFSNFISGVSSITKLVESTGSKVITGGLDTLETIGKKTMKILQEGDPGLKKKRAFFMNEINKPILSQILKEVKEKADAEDKTLEKRQAAKKVCFESLFDDYQGLVHLEALEILSKQSNMKIQHKMINLDGQELSSMQETLYEVKELCDLGDDDEEAEAREKDLKDKLKVVCQDLGINVTYDKLNNVIQNINSRIDSCISSENKSLSHRELFERAISALAQFTAYSVETFHKTAELLLIKERRSTVSEADALVELARILSGQISVIAILFCDKLNEMKNYEMSNINSNITSIFLEAANASSYVQDAFRLLIPIIQVGAI